MLGSLGKGPAYRHSAASCRCTRCDYESLLSLWLNTLHRCRLWEGKGGLTSLHAVTTRSFGQRNLAFTFYICLCGNLPVESTEISLVSSHNGQLMFIECQSHTRNLSITEEGLDVIFRKAIVQEHSIKLLKILNMMLERDLLLPTTCGVKVSRISQRRFVTGPNITVPVD